MERLKITQTRIGGGSSYYINLSGVNFGFLKTTSIGKSLEWEAPRDTSGIGSDFKKIAEAIIPTFRNRVETNPTDIVHKEKPVYRGTLSAFASCAIDIADAIGLQRYSQFIGTKFGTDLIFPDGIKIGLVCEADDQGFEWKISAPMRSRSFARKHELLLKASVPWSTDIIAWVFNRHADIDSRRLNNTDFKEIAGYLNGLEGAN